MSQLITTGNAHLDFSVESRVRLDVMDGIWWLYIWGNFKGMESLGFLLSLLSYLLTCYPAFSMEGERTPSKSISQKYKEYLWNNT